MVGACLAGLLFSGCMPKQSASLVQDKQDTFSSSTQIIGVPFFPQQDYQCGPAALAMTMVHAGVEVSPKQLRPELYIPKKRGSLQIEMMATPRRYGLLAYPLKPQLVDILKEIEAGHPVIIFQNLGLSFAPQWHYAVATGFNLAEGEITLHSGNTADYSEALTTFERTWVRADSWAMVVLAAGQLPSTATMKDYLKATVGLEQAGFQEAALKSYEAALSRWPENLTAWMGAGNTHYALGNIEEAANAFSQASLHHPKATGPLNNLAQIRLEQGRNQDARAAIQRAIELDHTSELLQRTRSEIENRTDDNVVTKQ